MFDREAFSEYVNGQSWYDKSRIGERMDDVADFHVFLSRRGVRGVNDITGDDVSAYVSEMRERSGDVYQTLLIIALYGEFLKNEELCSEVFLLFDAAGVMDRLSELTREHLGEEVWRKIFGDVKMPEIGWTLDEMSDFTRDIEKRFLLTVPREKYERVCVKNAHAWDPAWNGNEREEFLKMKSVDKFIEARNDGFMKELEKFRDSGELFFSQAIDDEVIAYMRENPVCRREGDKLIFTKIPFSAGKYLRETDAKMKRYYACHCPWAKRSILRGEPVSRSFCHCSLGHAKKSFDNAFGRELNGVIIETVLDGNGLKCVFEVGIPGDIMELYV